MQPDFSSSTYNGLVEFRATDSSAFLSIKALNVNGDHYVACGDDILSDSVIGIFYFEDNFFLGMSPES